MLHPVCCLSCQPHQPTAAPQALSAQVGARCTKVGGCRSLCALLTARQPLAGWWCRTQPPGDAGWSPPMDGGRRCGLLSGRADTPLHSSATRPPMLTEWHSRHAAPFQLHPAMDVPQVSHRCLLPAAACTPQPSTSTSASPQQLWPQPLARPTSLAVYSYPVRPHTAAAAPPCRSGGQLPRRAAATARAEPGTLWSPLCRPWMAGGEGHCGAHPGQLT